MFFFLAQLLFLAGFHFLFCPLTLILYFAFTPQVILCWVSLPLECPSSPTGSPGAAEEPL